MLKCPINTIPMKTFSMCLEMEWDSCTFQVFVGSNIIGATFGLPNYVIIFKEADYPIGVYPYVIVNQRYLGSFWLVTLCLIDDITKA